MKKGAWLSIENGRGFDIGPITKESIPFAYFRSLTAMQIFEYSNETSKKYSNFVAFTGGCDVNRL
jgi:hypothetical protein